MKFVHIGRLQRASTSRKSGYNEAIMRVGTPITKFGQPFYQITEADYAALRKEFAINPRTDAPKTNPIPATPGAQRIIPSSQPTSLTSLPSVKKPGPLQLARNAAAAATRVITAATKGQKVQATGETFAARMKICSTCEFSDKASNPRCSVCGCYLASQIIGKARLATETCPKGKW